MVAIVVPEVESVKGWAREQDIPGTLSVLCANPHVKQLIMDDITNLGKAAGLKSFEQVGALGSEAVLLWRVIFYWLRLIYLFVNHYEIDPKVYEF